VSVGACELTEHEPVKPIRFPARGTKPVSGGLDLIGMQGQHGDPGVQQSVDQQPVGAFDRDQLNLETLQRVAQRADAVPWSCANVAPNNSSPARSSISTSCLSDAQSIPAQLPIINLRFVGHSIVPRPGGTGRVGERRLGCAARAGPTGLVSSRRHLEPCMRFSRTRLSDVLHRRHSAPLRHGR